MRYLTTVLYLSLAVFAIDSLAMSQDLVYRPIRVTQEFPDRPANGGDLQMVLNISSDVELGLLKVILRPHYGAEIKGDTLKEYDVGSDKEYSLRVDMRIPDNDTTMIEMVMFSKARVPGHATFCRTFITTGDTLEIHNIGRDWMRKNEAEAQAAILEAAIKEAQDTFSDSRMGGKAVANVNYVSKKPNGARLEQCTQLRSASAGNEVSVTLTPFNGAEVEGETSWMEYFPSVRDGDLLFRRPQHTRWYDVTFPANDTSGIILNFVCGQYEQETRVTFITTGDTAEFWLGHPMAEMPMYWSPRTDSALVVEYHYLFPPGGDQTWTKRAWRKLTDQAKKHGAGRHVDSSYSDRAWGAPVVLNVNYVSKGSTEARLEQYTYPRDPESCREIQVTLEPFGGADVQGKTAWVENYPEPTAEGRILRNAENTKWYDVTFPGGDTSGIWMNFVCGEQTWRTEVTFVTTGDTAEFWLSVPEAERPMYPSLRTDPSLVEKYNPVFPPGGDASFTTEGKRMLPDSTIARMKEEKRQKKLLDAMARKEQEPCPSTTQQFRIGDEVWERHEGEYKFHIAEQPADDRGPISDMTFRLTDADHYHFVNDLVPSLEPTDRDDWYRAEVTKEELFQIIDHGIPIQGDPHPRIARELFDKYGAGQAVAISEMTADESRRAAAHLTMDLSDPDDRAFVEGLAEDLQPMDRAGFYSGFVKVDDIRQIRKRGIAFAKYPAYPNEN